MGFLNTMLHWRDGAPACAGDAMSDAPMRLICFLRRQIAADAQIRVNVSKSVLRQERKIDW